MKCLIFLAFLAVSAVAARSHIKVPSGDHNAIPIIANDIDTVQAQPLCEPGKRFESLDIIDGSCICNAAGSAYTCSRNEDISLLEITAKAGKNDTLSEKFDCPPCTCTCTCS